MQNNTLSLKEIFMQNFNIKITGLTTLETNSSNLGWQEKALSLQQVIISALEYKCRHEGGDMSQSIIELHLPLNKIASLYVQAVEEQWPAEIHQSLEKYLNTLAGFDMNKVDMPSEWDPEAIRQHSYLIKQLISPANPV